MRRAQKLRNRMSPLRIYSTSYLVSSDPRLPLTFAMCLFIDSVNVAHCRQHWADAYLEESLIVDSFTTTSHDDQLFSVNCT